MIKLRELLKKATKGRWEVLVGAQHVAEILAPTKHPDFHRQVICKMERDIPRFHAEFEGQENANAQLIIHLVNNAEKYADVVEAANFMCDLTPTKRDIRPLIDALTALKEAVEKQSSP